MIDPNTLNFGDLVASDPPPVMRLNRPVGLAGRFKTLIRQTPGVWYKYPKIVSSRSIGTTDGYEWVQRTVKDANGKSLGIQLYCRYTGK